MVKKGCGKTEIVRNEKWVCGEDDTFCPDCWDKLEDESEVSNETN